MITRSQTPSTLIIEVEESKVKASTNIQDSDDEDTALYVIILRYIVKILHYIVDILHYMLL